MSEAQRLQPLILDLLEWCDRASRTYSEVIDAWRTSCPRLPVWETAIDEKLLRRGWSQAYGAVVEVTDNGRRFLEIHGRAVSLPLS